MPQAVRAALAVGREGAHALELRRTDLGTLCRAAARDVVERYPGRTIEYEPDPGREGSGVWDPTRVAYAIAILLEDALQRCAGREPVQLRWREHAREAVFRVQFPRPVAPGERLVSVFEGGALPEPPVAGIGTLRLLVAARILEQHRGSLARVRTRAGTTYVATLPRVRRKRRA